MAKFNTKAKPQDQPNTVNLAGGQAYVNSAKLQLVTLLFTSFLSTDKNYEKVNDTQNRLVKLISEIDDKQFIAKAAIYARDKYNMRSVSHIVAGELALLVKNEQWTKDFFNKVVIRVDDMTEILSYYASKKGLKNNKIRSIPNAMKKGFAKALGRFDAYQLAKYKGEGKGVKLIDLVNLIHPKPTEKNGTVEVLNSDLEAIYKAVPYDSKTHKLLSKIFNNAQLEGKYRVSSLTALSLGLLKNTDTWESKISSAGQEAKSQIVENNLSEEEAEELKTELKGQGWKELLESRKIGYFALLRNLSNILKQAPDCIDKACELLVDEKLIKKSRVLPFRFLTAYNELKGQSGSGIRKILNAISQALDISLNNVPELKGKTLVVLDTSGSMTSEYIKSQNPKETGSKLSCADIGKLFAAVLYKKNIDADLMLFSDDAKYVNLNSNDSVITISEGIRFISGGTNFNAIFRTANKAYDRVIILSDMQGWKELGSPYKSTYKEYVSKYGKPFMYSFDLSGLGSSMFPEDKVTTLAGFSDKVFDLMKNVETDKSSLIDDIEKINLL